MGTGVGQRGTIGVGRGTGEDVFPIPRNPGLVVTVVTKAPGTLGSPGSSVSPEI
jgi:hypothetical protein